jgi:hypothetical protein
MDAQELQMVLDTIKSVAETASSAGLVWIIVHYFVQLAQITVVPVCAVIAVARIGKSFVAHRVATLREASNVKQQVSANEVEKTKQRQLELEKEQASVAGKTAVQQLCSIAEAAGVTYSQYSGIYQEADLAKIVKLVTPAKTGAKP